MTFVGRLATYRYYNMDQIVGQALAAFRRTFLQADDKPAEAQGMAVSTRQLASASKQSGKIASAA